MLEESCSWEHANQSQRTNMVPGKVSGSKNREPMMAGVLGGDYRNEMANRLLRSLDNVPCTQSICEI